MNDRELELLARAFFRNCAENAPVWKEIGIKPEDNENLCRTAGFKTWRAKQRQLGWKLGIDYDLHRKIINSAENYLNNMGYQTTSIRSATPNTVSVRVANASSIKFCVRVPKEIALNILILGFVPKVSLTRKLKHLSLPE